MSRINKVTFFSDAVKGEVVRGKNATTGREYTYLKGGNATLEVRGKKQQVRINWFGVTEELLNRGVTLQADIELNEYDGKTYTQLNVRDGVAAFSGLNQAIITGKIVGFKDYQKLLSVEVEITGTNRDRKETKAVQKVTVLDKDGAIAQAIKANKGNEMLLIGSLTPNNGFTDYTITSASAIGAAGAGTDVSLDTAPVDPADDVF